MRGMPTATPLWTRGAAIRGRDRQVHGRGDRRTLSTGLGGQLRSNHGLFRRVRTRADGDRPLRRRVRMAATPSRVELFVPPAAEAGLLVEIDDLRAPTRRLLRVSGELDLATVGVLGSAIQRAAADRREVELDVSGVA